MMTLEEAIAHTERVYLRNKYLAKLNRAHGGWHYDDLAKQNDTVADEYFQYYEFLRELQEYRKTGEGVDDFDIRN